MKMYSFMDTASLLKAILASLTLLCTLPQNGHAQEQYAVFIHGITFGDSRPNGVKDKARCRLRRGIDAVYEEKNPFRQKACNSEWERGGSRLKASGTPQQWTGGVIDGYIRLRYFDRDLYDDAGGIERDVTLDDTREAMMRRFVNQMQDEASNAEWVLVGHSQGGIVARLLRARSATGAER